MTAFLVELDGEPAVMNFEQEDDEEAILFQWTPSYLITLLDADGRRARVRDLGTAVRDCDRWLQPSVFTALCDSTKLTSTASLVHLMEQLGADPTIVALLCATRMDILRWLCKRCRIDTTVTVTEPRAQKYFNGYGVPPDQPVLHTLLVRAFGRRMPGVVSDEDWLPMFEQCFRDGMSSESVMEPGDWRTESCFDWLFSTTYAPRAMWLFALLGWSGNQDSLFDLLVEQGADLDEPHAAAAIAHAPAPLRRKWEQTVKELAARKVWLELEWPSLTGFSAQLSAFVLDFVPFYATLKRRERESVRACSFFSFA